VQTNTVHLTIEFDRDMSPESAARAADVFAEQLTRLLTGNLSCDRVQWGYGVAQVERVIVGEATS
jgi:hypothetical protein